ncbi:hypothetical protein DEH84_17725 (plasmid) [Aquabacterium olei]|jgi:hypothetical protein|uniref:Cellulose biosynthesis protein BcsS n=1 Tax=Aquabacterium olei TaxID=1296669 RepID=A0A2U8FWJ3_9BURK|nr:cellulose biosynthesis protein BcsS [Aquabacterium olei]AWI55432.1 hypothetical protein DEH84_17725 [Aquabacterium olei]
MNKLVLALIAPAIAAGSPEARAQSAATAEAPWLAFGGAQFSGSSAYTYAGAVRFDAGQLLGSGPFSRAVVSMLRYRYDTEQNGQRVRVHAHAPGIEFARGHAWSTGSSQIELALAVGARHSRLDPQGLDDSVEGTRASVSPQAALIQQLADGWTLEARAAYSLGPRDHHVRLRGHRPVGGAWVAGAEAAYQAGRRYADAAAGVVIGRNWDHGVQTTFSAGQQRDRDGRTGTYLTFGMSWVP